MNPRGNPSTLTRAGMGRPKGSKNLATRTRDEIIEIYEKLGGQDAYLRWLKEEDSRRANFYQKTLPALLPKVTELEETAPYILKIVTGEDGNTSEQDNQTESDASEIHIKP